MSWFSRLMDATVDVVLDAIDVIGRWTEIFFIALLLVFLAFGAYCMLRDAMPLFK